MSAHGWKRLHGTAAVVFTLVWVLAALTGWIDSVRFVSHVSMLGLVYAALACWQGSRTEVKQDKNGS